MDQMHSTTELALREFRQRVNSELQILKVLESRFEDPHLKRMCQHAIQDIQAPETMFLRLLETETWRAPAEEARVLGYAESIFQIEQQVRKQLGDIMQKFGPSAEVRPG
jgi:hypothetical protein